MALLNEALRIVIVLQAAFVFGISVVTIFAYRKRPQIAHISAVACSYVILTGVVVHSLFVEAYPRLSGKGAWAFLAFMLGDFALLKVLSQRKNGSSGEKPPDFWRKEFREAIKDTMKPEYLK